MWGGRSFLAQCRLALRRRMGWGVHEAAVSGTSWDDDFLLFPHVDRRGDAFVADQRSGNFWSDEVSAEAGRTGGCNAN